MVKKLDSLAVKPLFALLETRSALPTLAPACIQRAVLKRSETFDVYYWLLELSRLHKERSTLQVDSVNYTLHEHHLSIYASDSNTPHINDYHYSATVQSNAQELILHVYFKLDSTSTPVVVLRDGIKTIPLSDIQQEFFRELSNFYTHSMVVDILSYQKHVLANLTDSVNVNLQNYLQLPQTTIEEVSNIIQLLPFSDAIAIHTLGGGSKVFDEVVRVEEALKWQQCDLHAAAASCSSTKRGSPVSAAVAARRSSPSSHRAEEHVSVIDAPPVVAVSVAPMLVWQQRIDELNKLHAQCLDIRKLDPAVLDTYYTSALDAQLAEISAIDDEHIPAGILLAVAQHVATSRQLVLKRLDYNFLLESDLIPLAAFIACVPQLAGQSMQIAITRGRLDQVQYLLQHHFNVRGKLENSANKKFFYPLVVAYEKRQLDIFQLLLQYGASALYSEINGLPLAHTILLESTTDQSLQPYRDLILDTSLHKRQAFMQHLANNLQQFLESDAGLALVESQKKILVDAIGIYSAEYELSQVVELARNKEHLGGVHRKAMAHMGEKLLVKALSMLGREPKAVPAQAVTLPEEMKRVGDRIKVLQDTLRYRDAAPCHRPGSRQIAGNSFSRPSLFSMTDGNSKEIRRELAEREQAFAALIAQFSQVLSGVAADAVSADAVPIAGEKSRPSL